MVQIVISSAGAGGLAQWVLVELQGEVEPRQSGGLAGSLLGDLHYTCEVRQPTAVPRHQGMGALSTLTLLLFSLGGPRSNSWDTCSPCNDSISETSRAEAQLPSQVR
uniref:Uncharacterized protein n=1 Tax=Falco tinnunculus TaxID=100819 RepID=A0A8C4U347_FALTI